MGKGRGGMLRLRLPGCRRPRLCRCCAGLVASARAAFPRRRLVTIVPLHSRWPRPWPRRRQPQGAGRVRVVPPAGRQRQPRHEINIVHRLAQQRGGLGMAGVGQRCRRPGRGAGRFWHGLEVRLRAVPVQQPAMVVAVVLALVLAGAVLPVLLPQAAAEAVHQVLRGELGAVAVGRAAQPLVSGAAAEPQVAQRGRAQQPKLVALRNLHRRRRLAPLAEAGHAAELGADVARRGARARRAGGAAAAALRLLPRRLRLLLLQGCRNGLIELALAVAARALLDGLVEVAAVIYQRARLALCNRGGGTRRVERKGQAGG